MYTCAHAYTQEIHSTYTSVRMYNKFIFKRREGGSLQRAAGRGDAAGALMKEGIRRLRKEKSDDPQVIMCIINKGTFDACVCIRACV